MRTSSRSLVAILTGASLMATAACTSITSDDSGSGGKADDTGIAPELREAALANLRRLEKEIDYANHLSKYRLEGPVPEQFLSWSELNVTPYDKEAVDPYTRTRVILMNGIEVE